MYLKVSYYDNLFPVSPKLADYLKDFHYCCSKCASATLFNQEIVRQLESCDIYKFKSIVTLDSITDDTVEALECLLEIYPYAEEEILTSLHLFFDNCEE